MQCLFFEPGAACLAEIEPIGLEHQQSSLGQAIEQLHAQPARQVISLSGDGGLAMMLGDLLTAIQEDIPIKVAVFNNSSLGFVELATTTPFTHPGAG